MQPEKESMQGKRNEALLLKATAHPPEQNCFCPIILSMAEYHLLLSSLAEAFFSAVLFVMALPSVPISCTVMMVALNFLRALYAFMAVLK